MMRLVDVAVPGTLAAAAPFAESFGTTPYGFLAALAGVMAAVVLLPDKDVRLATGANWRKQVTRVAWLGIVCLCWALVAANVAHWAVLYVDKLSGAPEVQINFACGVLARPFLPMLMRIAKRRTQRLGDGSRD